MPPRPIVQIFCRCCEKLFPEQVRSGTGFIDVREKKDTLSATNSLDVSLFPGQVLHIGRARQLNDIAILHQYISRQHFVIYSVEYEKRWLVYVRDCGSLSGTYVYDRSPLHIKLPSSSGYLLSQDEIIKLDPYWEFHLSFLDEPISSPVSELSSNEMNLFSDIFFINQRILGCGAFSKVHLAINLKTRRQVACKVHRLDQSLDTTLRNLNEIEILSQLTHPNLLRVEAVFRSFNTLYTFTELATGGDLHSIRLKNMDGLLEMETKLIIRQIVDVISYLHKQNVAHRDLKPENVFLATGPTNMARVIVGDLGFAKLSTSGRMTSRLGTRGFTAPEVYRKETYGHKADIWSIGKISLFLVALDGKNLDLPEIPDQDAVDKYLTNEFADSSFRGKFLSHDFQTFVRECLVVEPSGRKAADGLKTHNWFRSSENQLDVQIRKFTSTWKPASVIHNSMQGLSQLESTKTQTKLSTAPSKRNVGCDGEELMDSQVSRYFTRRKRQKSPPRLILTSPNGQIHLGI